MARLDAKVRELVSSAELESTVTHLCGLGEKVAGSEEERKACDHLTGRLMAIVNIGGPAEPEIDRHELATFGGV